MIIGATLDHLSIEGSAILDAIEDLPHPGHGLVFGEISLGRVQILDGSEQQPADELDVNIRINDFDPPDGVTVLDALENHLTAGDDLPFEGGEV